MKDNNFKNYHKKYVSKIDLAIESYFDKWNNEVAQISPRLLPLLTVLQEGCKGGKRIRGVLVALGYSLFTDASSNSEKEKAITQVAVAYEIFQTAILAHDDIIDKSELRRGMPTLYQQLGNNHYGVSQTICIGDLGFFTAYKIISETAFPDALKIKAISFFSDSITKTLFGEMLDVEFAHKKVDVAEQLLTEVLTVYALKTAYYTFVAPLSLGAILAGADENVLRQIKTFGENVGVLFQVNDDINDIFGDTNTTKKDIGADVKEGKITLLYAKAMQLANAKQHDDLSKLYGKALIDEKTLKEVQKIFVETGALAHVTSLAETYEAKARAAIETISQEKSTQQLLHQIVDFVSEKKKESHD